ncbi:MAG: hypothetical protein IPI46_12075 [Bacteroidetes bacterium]|nr:hypothetical protein [Bacteroidota bacterium]
MKQTNNYSSAQGKVNFALLKVCILMCILFCTQSLFSQTTLNTTAVTGWSNNNGSGTVTFNFQNTNGFPIIITTVEGVVTTAGASTAEIWIKTTPVSGLPGVISVANGWTQVATGSFTGVASGTSLVTQTFLSGLSVTIPAGVTYGMAIFATSQRYHSMVAPNVPLTTVSGGGCNILMGTGISYGGGAPNGAAPTFTPRGWIGKLTFIPAGPCTDPPTPGTPAATASSICAGQSSVLSLTGGTGGTGQSYQWESSTTSGGPYTDIIGATSASYVSTPTVTTYYRNKVTCGASTVPSTEISVTVAPLFPGGNYTIDATLPTGGTNFQSFTAAVAAISCGISSPVVFDVEPGTGPYIEQITLPATIGADATKTVTFNGNGEAIQFASANANLRHVIKLDGADYITFDNLIINATGTYGWGIHFMNGADYNTISLCTINTSVTDITLSNHHPVVMSNSATVTTTTGNNGNYNTFIDNTFNGGYYSVTAIGNAVGTEAIGNNFTNNAFRNSYSYSLYMLYQKGANVTNNDFSRTLRTASTTTAGIFMTTGCLGNLIESNRIHNFFDAFPASTSIMYSIYCAADATALQPNRVINNLVYNINHNGTTYGCYNAGGDYEQIYHNTFSLDNTGSTAGITYGIYQTTAAVGLDFRNNLITISRGGTGAKVGLYYNTITSAITSNHNVVFLNSAGTGAQNFGSWGATPYATQALWNAATTLDGSSLQTNPLYVAPLAADFTPTSTNVNNAGTNIGVAYDILGAARNVLSPDPGAYEFSVSPIDAGVFSFVSPNNSGCYSANENVEIVIKNYGSLPLDFSLNPLTVNVDVSGTATANLTANPTGILAPGATMNVIVSPPLNMTANGTYLFNAYTTVAGDGNSLNDILPGVSRIVGPVGGTITSTLSTICVSSTPTLSISGHYGGSIQWMESTVSASGPWTNVGSGGNSYTPSTPVTQTSWYQVEISCNGNTANSNVLNIVVNNPLLLSTTPGSRCGFGSVTLGATANPGSTINWYANATGGSILGSGTSFATPSISSTTNFYAAASDGGGGGPFTAPMPTLGTPFSGNVRGFWFTAPSAFTITGLNVPLTGATQSMAVVKFVPAVGPPTFSTVTNAFTVLYLIQNSTNTGVLPVNIPIASGDVIGILGQIGTQSAYASVTGPYTTTINGTPVTCTRMGMQFPLGTTSPQDLWQELSGAIGVVNITYTNGCEGVRTAVTATVAPSDTLTATSDVTYVCSGAANSTANLSASSANTNYTYTWMPGNLTGPNVSVTPTSTTTYTVTGTDGICANTKTVTVNATVIIAPVVNATPTTICQGDATNLSAFAPSAPPTGYTLTTIPYAYEVPTGTISVLANAGIAVTPQTISSLDDGTWENLPLPFSFNYYGTVYNNFNVSTNGFISLGTSLGGAFCCSGQGIPAAAAPNAYIALAHEDWLLSTSGTIDYFTNGVAPNRKFVVRFTAVPRFGGTGAPTTGEIILNESGSVVDFQVTSVTTASGDNTTMGIENPTGTSAVVVSGRNSTSPWTATNEGWRFAPTQLMNFLWTPNGVGSGIVAGNETLANTSATPSTTTTYTMTITEPLYNCTLNSSVTVTVNPTSSSTTTASACTPPYVWNGNTYTTTGIYTYTTTNAVGCDSVATLDLTIAPCNTTLNLTCFIQGYWDGNSQMQPVLANQGEPTTMGACDTITVELHSDIAPYGIDASTTAVLQQNGTATCIFPPVTGNKYIVVKHRSAVQTWSTNPVVMGTTLSYNFSTAANQAFGDNQIQISTSPVIYAFYSGDIVIDENIDLLDLGYLETEISNFSFGFNSADLNGDGNVDLLDSPLLEANISNFIFSNHP